MEMAQEMMGDTLDSALDDEATEDDAAELVGQVGAPDARLHAGPVGAPSPLLLQWGGGPRTGCSVRGQ